MSQSATSGAPIDWAATAAWVQAIGSVIAIWFAGRVAILQQRLQREQAIAGVFATVAVAHQVVTDAATAARDHEMTNAWAAYDTGRIDQAIRWLQGVSPQAVGEVRLTELVAEQLPLLLGILEDARQAHSFANQSFGVRGGLWEQMSDAEQQSALLYAEAGRILTRAQRERRRWWLW